MPCLKQDTGYVTDSYSEPEKELQEPALVAEGSGLAGVKINQG
jgi:hypothetical protein